MSCIIGVSAFLSVPSYGVLADEPEVNLKPDFTDDYSTVKQNFTTIDVSEYVTTTTYDDVAGDGIGGWSDQGSVNDFSPYKLKGNVKLCDIPFNLPDLKNNPEKKSVIMLAGREDKRFPLSVEIPINSKAGGVYILHNNVWGTNKGAVHGTYTYVYDDGTEYSIDQRGGMEIPGWWGSRTTDYAITAWTGANPSYTISNYIYGCVNPYPDKTIAKMRFESNDSCYIAIFGLTLTDIHPILYKEKEKNWGNPDTTDWFRYEPCFDADKLAGTPLDVSWLPGNDTAGTHGAIKIDGENFVYEDGTRERIWGVNLQVYGGLYPSHRDSDFMAKRIAQSGFNCVRICHPMATFGGTVFYSQDWMTKRPMDINEEIMDKFCYLLYALKKQGLVVLMQQVGMSTTYINDELNIQDANCYQNGYGQFDKDILELVDYLNNMFLEYVNPYTGKRIVDDESLIALYMYNENTIFNITDYSGAPYYYNELKNYFNEWLRAKYKTRDELEKAWYEEGTPGLLESENQFDSTVEVTNQNRYKQVSNARSSDCMRFLIDLIAEKYSERLEKYRNMGYKNLVVGSTDWGNYPVSTALANLKSLDLQDYHDYNCLIQSANANSSAASKPTSDIDVPTFGFTGRIGGRRVYGAPYTITEWNAAIANPFATESYLFVSAFGCMQNWNPFVYCWAERPELELYENLPLEKQMDTELLSLINMPSQQYSLPATSMLFRRQDVTEADKGYYPVRKTQFDINTRDQSVERDFSYGLVGKTGTIYDEYKYDESANDNDVLKLKLIGDKTGVYNSVTGEMQTDRNSRIFRLNTERTQASTGFFEGKSAELSDVEFEIDNPFATVYLSSLSFDSIAECDSLLLTTVGRHKNWEQQMSDDASTFLTNPMGPIIVEPITGSVTLKSYDDFDVYALGFDGQRAQKIETYKDGSGYTVIPLTAKAKTLNYEIVRTKKSDIRCNDEVVFDTHTEKLADDLGEYQCYEKEIERCILQGFIKLVGEKKFAPDKLITRAQFAYMLANAVGLYGETDDMFADVPQGSEYFSQINALKEAGVAGGDSNGNFNPDSPITVEQMAVMTERAVVAGRIQRYKNNAVDTGAYSDWNDISDYAKDSVEYLISEQCMNPSDGKINPKKLVNRAEAAVMIYNILWK